MGGDSQAFLVSLNNLVGSKRPIFTRKHRVTQLIKGRYLKSSRRYSSSTRRILMKRSRRAGGGLEIVRRRNQEVERKVRTLKKLVPNCSQTMGLDGLFRDTADYILALQMRIKFMQFMVNGFSSNGSDNTNID